MVILRKIYLARWTLLVYKNLNDQPETKLSVCTNTLIDQSGIRTKHPTDKTPHVHFVIGGRKPPHVFLKADKTPHAQKYNVDKTPHADFKIRTKPPSCFS